MEVQSRISDASFRVNYGDYKFILPLSAVQLNQEVQQIGGNVATASIQFNIEKTVGSTPLSSAMSAHRLIPVATPADFSATLIAGTKQKELKDYDGYVTRAFVVPNILVSNPEQLAVVRYDEQAGGITYVPTNAVSGNGNTTVSFKRKSNSVYAVVRTTPIPYPDMRNHWASDDVALLASKFIVDGPTASKFDPDKNITRADFAKFIVKGMGLSGDTASAVRFKDVSVSGTAAPYIGAASKAGIVSGGTDGNFRPDATITREEMASMMARAMVAAGVERSITTDVLARFADRSKISSFATAAVKTCVDAGVISGVTPTKFSPKENATRAQAASMIKRFLQAVEFLP
jgi:trimeric autotransporter adhesin